MARLAFGLILGICLAIPAVGNSQWQSAGTLPVPQYNYTFLATTPSGDVLAATYNRGAAPVDLPALLIRNPISDHPEVVELCRVPFPIGRGFGGIASDGAGNFFVTGDTGEQKTSFIRKFFPDGSAAENFGNNGAVFPNRRCLGLATLANYLMVAVDWGEILIFDAFSGQALGAMPKPPELTYVRDIAIDSRSLRVFGVARGAIVTWGRGAPWQPSAYQYRTITEPYIPPMMGEGITIDPFRRCVVISPPAGGEVREVFGNGEVIRSPIQTLQENSSLTDAAISFDGKTLFVSDYSATTIHVLRRESPGAAPSASQTASGGGYTAIQTAGEDHSAPAIEWQRSYTGVLEQTRQAGKPMLVYFRMDIAMCNEFEENILLTGEFNRFAQGFTCVFEDTSANPLLAFQFGILRVPHVVIFDSTGEQVGELGHPIDIAQMAELMRQAQ